MTAIPEIIDVEAAAEDDARIPEDVVGFDMSAIHGEGWAAVDQGADASDPLTLSLEQWLGKEAVAGMKAAEIEALRRGVSRLPEPEAEDSFVWDAIRSPEDIAKVAEAVVGYRCFDPACLSVSEAMGANLHFRKAVKATRAPPSTKLGDYLDRERNSLSGIEGLTVKVDGLAEAMSAAFGDHGFTVSSGLVALAAAESLAKASPRLSPGFSLPRAPADGELEVLDRLRRKLVGASEAVRKACAVDPLLYSRGVLSGVRRSISERRAGDFVFAVEALGGSMDGEDRIAEAGRAFAAYLAAEGSFCEAAASMGFADDDCPKLVAHLLVRRCFRSAARSLGIEWEEVAPFLSARPDLSGDDFRILAERLAVPGLSGRLKAVSKDWSKRLSEVRDAAYRLTVSRKYWMEAGERVRLASPMASLHDVRQVIDIEPAMAKSKDVLREHGATSSADVDPLERHLEWMISAYALPIPDQAVDRIIETRAGIIPLRLAGRG